MKTKTTTKPRKATQMKTKTPTTKKKPAIPAAMRPHPRPTIDADLVDDLFSETIANLTALQAVWHRVSMKEELS